MSQVDSIFISRKRRRDHKQWIKEWPKIKGAVKDMSSICAALKEVTEECEHNVISIAFLPTDDNLTQKSLNQLEPTFMYTQVLKDILLTMQYDEQHFEQFMDYCREVFVGKARELDNVNKLAQTYGDKTPIWWYTLDCFLYSMFNRALRLMEIDVIIRMGFFIKDLHRHIQDLYMNDIVYRFYGKKSIKLFVVYRGQGLSKIEFDKMMKTKGGLMSFNNFLSTSMERKISLKFACRAARNPDLVGILFVMSIDPRTLTAPFNSIKDFSFFKTEDEILFSMHTVFRIHDSVAMDQNQSLFQVDLNLINEEDNDLHGLTEYIRSGLIVITKQGGSN
jgi:hypothetical protein